jgi:hypothetical protein
VVFEDVRDVYFGWGGSVKGECPVGYGGSELESGGELFGLRRDRTVMGRTDSMWGGGVLDQRLSREREIVGERVGD